jgi:uncharacterized membrane protein
MEILIGIALIVLIIYGLVKLIIWLAPIVAKGFLIVLAVGGLAGLVVGTFFGIKNYMQSIHENISNKAFKVTMMFITSLFILMLLFIIGSIGYGIVQDKWFRKDFFYEAPVITETETFTNKIVDTDGLNVRAGPSSDSSVKFVLYRNTIIKVSDKDKSGDWVKINYNGQEGYVNQNFLKEAK